MSIAALAFESGETSLSVRSFRVEAQVLALRGSVIARSPDQIDLESIIGRAASLILDSGIAHVTSGARRWAGICHHIEQLQSEPTGLSTYEVRIMPALGRLMQRRGYRIYQHLTIPDIVGRLSAEWGSRPPGRSSATAIRGSSTASNTARATTRSSRECSRRPGSPTPSTTPTGGRAVSPRPR